MFALVDLIRFVEKTAEVRIRVADVSLENLDTVSRIGRLVERSRAGDS